MRTYFPELTEARLPTAGPSLAKICGPHDFDTNQSTKFGGAPYWTGNGVPAEIASDMRVLGQLNSWICTLEHPEDYVEIGNLCFDGIGYLYDQTPEASRPDLRFVISR
ncbi:hypothetical protein [Glutamicibacter sp. X7]